MNATPTIAFTDNDILRFIGKVELPADIDDKETCWVWVGAKHSSKRGYGSFWIHGHARPAHIVSYEMFNGPVPESKIVAHQCNNEFCVSPHHLEAQSQSENMQYCVASGRHNSQK